MITTDSRSVAEQTVRRPVAASGTWLFVLPWELHHHGGVNQVVMNLFDANEKVLGGRSLLVVKTWDKADSQPSVEDGRWTIRIPFRSPWSSQHPLRSLLSFLTQLPPTVRRLRQLIRSRSVECVHIHYPGLDSLVWPLLRAGLRPRPRLILSFHGTDLRYACEARGIGRFLWRALLGLVDEIVVPGDGLLKQLSQDFPYARAKASAVENGVDPPAIRLASEGRLPSWAPKTYICSLGTLDSNKGHDITLEAFDALAERYPDLALVIAGRVNKTAEFKRLEALRKSLHSASRIWLLPDLDHRQALRWLRNATVFVLASRTESFGIVVLEAGALSRPVIVTSSCGVAMRLRAGEELLVVPPANSVALAAAIEQLLEDRALADRLASALRISVEKDFTWATIVHRYESTGFND